MTIDFVFVHVNPFFFYYYSEHVLLHMAHTSQSFCNSDDQNTIVLYVHSFMLKSSSLAFQAVRTKPLLTCLLRSAQMFHNPWFTLNLYLKWQSVHWGFESVPHYYFEMASRPHEQSVCSCPDSSGSPVCDQCLPHYSGPQCDQCSAGFFTSSVGCVRCDCSGNADPQGPIQLCHPQTGHCFHCINNTTGPQCQRCAPGFVGNATAHNCTRPSELLCVRWFVWFCFFAIIFPLWGFRGETTITSVVDMARPPEKM